MTRPLRDYPRVGIVGIGDAPAAPAPSKGRHLAGNERLLRAWARGEMTRAQVDAELDRRVAEGGRTFWYLATPYPGFRDGPDAAFRLACETAAALIRVGVPVFSPVVHAHPIATVGGLDHKTRPAWSGETGFRPPKPGFDGRSESFARRGDAPMMAAASGLILLTAEGWRESGGMAAGRAAFEAAGKPVVFLMPGEVPAWLR